MKWLLFQVSQVSKVMSQMFERIFSSLDAVEPRETDNGRLASMHLVNRHWVSPLRPISPLHPFVSLAVLMGLGLPNFRTTLLNA